MEASGNRHAVTAEQLAQRVGARANLTWAIEEIRAALDAAAREALIQAADALADDSFDTDAYRANWGMGYAGTAITTNVVLWLRARADALSGRHEEETKT